MPFTSIIVGSGFVSRLTSLYGWTTRITFATPGRDSSFPILRSRSSPMTAITVRSTPYSGTGWSPCFSSCLRMASTLDFSVPLSITMIIFLVVNVANGLVSIGVCHVPKGHVYGLFASMFRGGVRCLRICVYSFHFFWVKYIKKFTPVLA